MEIQRRGRGWRQRKSWTAWEKSTLASSPAAPFCWCKYCYTVWPNLGSSSRSSSHWQQDLWNSNLIRTSHSWLTFPQGGCVPCEPWKRTAQASQHLLLLCNQQLFVKSWTHETKVNSRSTNRNKVLAFNMSIGNLTDSAVSDLKAFLIRQQKEKRTGLLFSCSSLGLPVDSWGCQCKVDPAFLPLAQWEIWHHWYINMGEQRSKDAGYQIFWPLDETPLIWEAAAFTRLAEYGRDSAISQHWTFT